MGSSRNSTSGRGDERGGEVEAPAHAAGVVLATLSPASARTNCSSSSGPGPRDAAAEVVQLADHHEVLAAGEQGVDGGVLGGEADAAADLRGLRRTSKPATRAVPRVGGRRAW